MKNIEEEIINVKDFLFNKNYRSNYSKVWYGTTETIREYVEVLDWKDVSRVLTVCSSGDHLFNLINQGIKKVDSFDINPLTYPYFKLRKAIMLANDYKNFYKFLGKLSIYSSSEKEEYQLFSSAKEFIDKPYDYFWEELYQENLRTNIHNITVPSLLANMCTNYIDPTTSRLRNKYYANEAEYEKTKNNLKNTEITFECTDVRNLPNVFKEKYDKIFLSNITDYFEINTSGKDIYKYTVENLKPLLSNNGELLAAYVYNYIIDKENQGIHFKCGFNNNEKIFNENVEVITVNNIDSWNTTNSNNKDAVLVYKK